MSRSAGVKMELLLTAKLKSRCCVVMLKRPTALAPLRLTYRKLPSSVSAIFPGWLPTLTGVPKLPVLGSIVTSVLPGVCVDAEFTDA